MNPSAAAAASNSHQTQPQPQPQQQLQQQQTPIANSFPFMAYHPSTVFTSTNPYNFFRPPTTMSLLPFGAQILPGPVGLSQLQGQAALMTAGAPIRKLTDHQPGKAGKRYSPY